MRPFPLLAVTSRVQSLQRRHHRAIAAARLGTILLLYKLLPIRGRLCLSGARFIVYQLRW
jgi:hypothetical protein